MREKIHSVLTALLTALSVFTGAIALPLLLRPFFHWHVDFLHLAEKTGISRELIFKAYDEVMDYCLGLRHDFAAGGLPFSPSGADHFADVRGLVVLNMSLLAASLLALFALWLYRHRAGFACFRFLGRSPGFWGAAGLALTGTVTGTLAALDFNRAFIIFHRLFFPGKINWYFDPFTDPVVLILPPEFFRDCALLILISMLAACAVLIWTGRGKK